MVYIDLIMLLQFFLLRGTWLQGYCLRIKHTFNLFKSPFTTQVI